MTSNTTRRTVLAGTAVLPVLSLPAISADTGTSFPAELTIRFDDVYKRWLHRFTLDHREQDEFEDLVSKATGFAPYEWPREGDDRMGMDSYFAAREEIAKRRSDRRSSARLDEHGVDITWNEINDDIREVTTMVLDRPTRSLADLALQLRAFALRESQVWTEDDHADTDSVRRLVEIACKFCGVDPLPDAEEIIQVEEEFGEEA